jgi:hypothetical protein
MKKHVQKMLAAVAGWRADALLLSGAGAVSFGAGQVYLPAGWMVGGVFLLAAGVLAARSGK